MKQSSRLVLALTAFALVGCSGGGTEPAGGGGGGGGGGAAYDHARTPGASAWDLLTSNDFDSLIVQVQYVQGFEPTAQGLQHLLDFLSARLNKPAGIVVQLDAPIQIQNQATYSAADVRAIEQAHRTVFTRGRTLATYLLFLDGEFEGQSNVLGIAYNNTSMAIFEEKITQYTGGIGQPPRSTVEGTVANHEFGHILGLVNNGTNMVTGHQDVPHGEHCDDPDCLMYYAVRTSDFINNLLGGLPTLDQNCLDDLRANGGK